MASIQDRSTPAQARWKVRWTDGRAAPERSYTFTSPPGRRAPSEAEKAARRLKAYLDLMGHQLDVLGALVGAGFRVEGVPTVALDEPEEVAELLTVAAYAARWLATLSRPTPRTRDDYRKSSSGTSCPHSAISTSQH